MLNPVDGYTAHLTALRLIWTKSEAILSWFPHIEPYGRF